MLRLMYLCEVFYPSFLADLLIGTLGAFFGIIGAYRLYVLSVHRERTDRLKYVVSLIESIIPSAITQSEFCREHVKNILQEPFENKLLQIEANRDTKRLADKVDQEGVYHAYLWKYKRNKKTYEQFKNLYASIDYLESLLEDMIKTNEKILNAVWSRKKQYQVTFSKTLDTLQAIILIAEIQQNQPAYVEYARNLIQQFSAKKTEKENVVDSYKEVVEPLSNFTIHNASQHPKISELLFLLDDLYRQFVGIELSSKHNAKDYEWYAEKLKTTANNLAEGSKQLQKDFSTK